MSTIPHEKLTQAAQLMAQFDLDAWLLLGRETGELCDPSFPLLMEAAVTWQSAFLVGVGGNRSQSSADTT